MISEKEKHRLSSLSSELHSIIRNVSILKHLRWDASVKHEFFKHNASQLPRVSYPEFEAQEKLNGLIRLQKKLQSSHIDQWLNKHIEVTKTTIAMLSSLGTKQFSEHSIELYGEPTQLLPDEENTSLDLAKKFNSLFTNAPVVMSFYSV